MTVLVKGAGVAQERGATGPKYSIYSVYLEVGELTVLLDLTESPWLRIFLPTMEKFLSL